MALVMHGFRQNLTKSVFPAPKKQEADGKELINQNGGKMQRISVTDLLEAGVHFGHQTKRWNPKVKEYIHGQKNGIHIINLGKTIHLLADACNFLQTIVSKGGKILFVGTKRQAQEAIKEAAQKTEMPFVADRWLGGTLTNNITIQKSIAKMQEIDKQLAGEEHLSLKKKEISALTRNSARLHRNLDGIYSMKDLPKALVVVDICHDDIAVKEALKLKIPIVAIVDTNADPSIVSYPIIANDDAVRSIKIITDTLAEAVKISLDLYFRKIADEKALHENEEKVESDERGEASSKPRSKAPARKRKAPSAGGGRSRTERAPIVTERVPAKKATENTPVAAEKAPEKAPEAAEKDKNAEPKKKSSPKTAKKETTTEEKNAKEKSSSKKTE